MQISISTISVNGENHCFQKLSCIPESPASFYQQNQLGKVLFQHYTSTFVFLDDILSIDTGTKKARKTGGPGGKCLSPSWLTTLRVARLNQSLVSYPMHTAKPPGSIEIHMIGLLQKWIITSYYKNRQYPFLKNKMLTLFIKIDQHWYFVTSTICQPSDTTASQVSFWLAIQLLSNLWNQLTNFIEQLHQINIKHLHSHAVLTNWQLITMHSIIPLKQAIIISSTYGT